MRNLPKELHFYKSINGWFDFQFIYTLAVKNAPHDAVFLEIGTANGQSTAYLAVESINEGKNITIHTVDKFGDNYQERYVRDMFKNRPNVVVHRATSEQYYNANKNRRYDFVFLDGAHDYYTVMFELEHFWPMLNDGGILGGHDYLNTGSDVKKAVDEFARKHGLKVELNYISFYIYKNAK